MFALAYILTRPFDSIKDNLIEIINDLIFLAVTILLSVFYQESSWDGK